jgi:hypothetical protein
MSYQTGSGKPPSVQCRPPRHNCTPAIPSGQAKWEWRVNEAFSDPVPISVLDGSATVMEGLGAASLRSWQSQRRQCDRHRAVLGRGAGDTVIAQVITQLVEIITHGSHGEALLPASSQPNTGITHRRA